MTDPLRQTLASPLGFTGLSETFFPGDRILFVPDAEMAGEPEILLEIVGVMLENGLADVSILLTEKESTASADVFQKHPEVHVVLHQPDRREKLALLGVDGNDEPIVLNRELIDADAVISVGLYHPMKNRSGHKEYFGPHSAFFPRFADRETQLRFSAMRARQKRSREAEEVARQLGVYFTIQFLRRQGSSERIVAGRPDLVVEELEKSVSAMEFMP